MTSDEYKSPGLRAVDTLEASGRALFVKTFTGSGSWCLYVSAQFNSEKDLDEAVQQGASYTLHTLDVISASIKHLTPLGQHMEKRSTTFGVNGDDPEVETVWWLESRYLLVDTCADMKLYIMLSSTMLPFWTDKKFHFRFHTIPVMSADQLGQMSRSGQFWTYPFDVPSVSKRAKWQLPKWD